MNEDSRYEAVGSRDARFDGEFFFAVVTTGSPPQRCVPTDAAAR